MTLNELLSSSEVKKMYKELSKKYHPDVNGDPEIMKKINKAKDEGDEKLKALYKELMNIQKKPKTINKNQYNKIKTWLEQIKKEIPSIIITIPRKNEDGSIYINVRTIDDGDFNIFDGIKYKTKEQLKNRIMNKMMR